MHRGEIALFAVRCFMPALVFFIIFPVAFAAPALSGVSASPPEVWLGESVTLSAVCTPAENESGIKSVYSEITGPIGLFPPDFSQGENGTYSLILSDSDRYGRIGTFNVAVYCASANGTSNQNTTFSVSNFSASISSVSPAPSYPGDIIEADVVAKKDGVKISSGVSFNVTINGESVSLLSPPAYDSIKGWMLMLSPPSSAGTHVLAVTANYGGASSVASTQLEVRDVFSFTFSGIDKSEVMSGDNVTATLSATSRGSPLSIDKSRLSAKVGSSDAAIADIYSEGGYYKAKIAMPSLSAARYDLKLKFSYGNFTAERAAQVSYMVTASGRMLDSAGAAVYTTLYFISGSTEKKVLTDSQGKYSINIPAGTYDLRLVHDKATLNLYGVSVSEFNDPLRFQYVSAASIPGIKSAGVFVYDNFLSSGSAKMVLNYDEGKVSREADLAVYRCSSWNSAKKSCGSSWEKISASIDSAKNIAEVSQNNPSGAYLVGTTDSLSLDFSLDKAKYFVGESITATGISQNSDRAPVANADIVARFLGGAKTFTAKSSAEGVFSLDIPVPDAEGNYTIVLSASLDPYAGSISNRTIEVLKKREISLVLPDNVRAKPGENATIEVSVINTGQLPLEGIKPVLSGIPAEYFRIFPESVSADAGAEAKFSIIFGIPESAAKTTYGADILLQFGGQSFKKTFALTIADDSKSALQAENSTSDEGPSIFPTGFATSAIAYDLAYLIGLSAVSISAAVFLRRRRLASASDLSGAESFKRRTYLLELRKAVEKGFGKQLKTVARTARKAKGKR